MTKWVLTKLLAFEPRWCATGQLVALGISRPLMPALKDVRHQVAEYLDE
jgi:hypothetical protein